MNIQLYGKAVFRVPQFPIQRLIQYLSYYVLVRSMDIDGAVRYT